MEHGDGQEMLKIVEPAQNKLPCQRLNLGALVLLLSVAAGCSQRQSLTWAQTAPAIEPLPVSSVRMGVLGPAEYLP